MNWSKIEFVASSTSFDRLVFYRILKVSESENSRQNKITKWCNWSKFYVWGEKKKKKKKRFLKIKGKMIYEKITVLFEFFIKMCKKGSLGTEGG